MNLTDIIITPQMVVEKLNKLKSNKAPGTDGLVSDFFLKTSGDNLLTTSIIFRKSLDEGVVPKDLKLANVSAIFKNDTKDNAGNYRPASLTAHACKLLESILRDNIIMHIREFNLINSSQHGFVKNRSCLTNFLKFLEYVCNYIDKGLPVDVICLDFRKTFDKVPHKRLMVKAHGIEGKILGWIDDWLNGRKQRVTLKGRESDWIGVLSGVSQGSVLGPVLFVIYILTLTVMSALKYLNLQMTPKLWVWLVVQRASSSLGRI